MLQALQQAHGAVAARLQEMQAWVQWHQPPLVQQHPAALQDAGADSQEKDVQAQRSVTAVSMLVLHCTAAIP